MPVCFITTNALREDDYSYGFDQLKKWAEIPDDECIFAGVSDQEKAQMSAFLKCRLFDINYSKFVLCELHLKENFEHQMKNKYMFSSVEVEVRNCSLQKSHRSFQPLSKIGHGLMYSIIYSQSMFSLSRKFLF